MEATREIFQDNLEEAGLSQGPFMFSYHEAASLMDTSAFHSPVSNCLQNINQIYEHINIKVAKIPEDLGDIMGGGVITNHLGNSLLDAL